jgi:hypothetical protein
MKKTMRVRLAPTRRTDLVCMACGRFRTEFAVVPVGGDMTRETVDSHVGVHRGPCMSSVHLRRQVSAAPESGESDIDDTDSGAGVVVG